MTTVEFHFKLEVHENSSLATIEVDSSNEKIELVDTYVPEFKELLKELRQLYEMTGSTAEEADLKKKLMLTKIAKLLVHLIWMVS